MSQADRDAHKAHVKALLADPSTPAEVLTSTRSLITAQMHFRAELAKHPNCPATVLKMLSTESPKVRALVAAHPNTPATVLGKMVYALDKGGKIKAALLANPNTPPEALTRLA